jgi:hypothetical protein
MFLFCVVRTGDSFANFIVHVVLEYEFISDPNVIAIGIRAIDRGTLFINIEMIND